MDSAMQIRLSPPTLPVFRPPSLPRSSYANLHLRAPYLVFPPKTTVFACQATASGDSNPSAANNFCIPQIRTAACAVILAAATFGGFANLHVRATVAPPTPVTEDSLSEGSMSGGGSPLTQLLSSNPETMEALKKLLQEKLEAGEDEESLAMLRKLTAAQPENLELKFLMARLLSEIGKTEEARAAFEDILATNPLSFEALFENALLMDRSGERESVMGRLEEALRVAESEGRLKEARDVKLIMAQMQFLHKNVDEALASYDELVKEDPSDFRPYFCKGMIFTLTDRRAEAREQFDKYRKLSPKKFEVEGYLRTPLSKMKLWTDEGI